VVEVEYGPFQEVNEMLFRGPFLAERFAAVGDFLKAHPSAGLDITRQIILGGEAISGAETFTMLSRLKALARETGTLWSEIDLMMVPTVGRAYTIAEVLADPLQPNFNLGYYTNFVNPLDLSALAVPNGFLSSGVPGGVTFIAPAIAERRLAALGAAFHGCRVECLGATGYRLSGREESAADAGGTFERARRE
jgi:allophanate hydrolase/aspartyl-tRNA(Asn)/glutamyl-tRNA(Gln) amidotransferase subunit A